MSNTIKLIIVVAIMAFIAILGIEVTKIKYRYTIKENIIYRDNSIKFDLYCKTEYKYGASSRRYLDTFSFKVDNPSTVEQLNLQQSCKKTANLYE